MSGKREGDTEESRQNEERKNVTEEIQRGSERKKKERKKGTE